MDIQISVQWRELWGRGEGEWESEETRGVLVDVNNRESRSSKSPLAHIYTHARFTQTQVVVNTISFPEPANFLRRMLDENEGSGKDQFLGDPDWLSEMKYDTISPLFADY